MESPVFQFEDVSREKLLSRNTVFVASSRLPRKPDCIPQFFDGLLKLAMRLDPQKDVLITADRTTCDLYVRRIAALFGIPLLIVEIVKGDCRRRSEAENREEDKVLVWDPDGCGTDLVLASLASNALVLSVRNGGNLYKSIRSRLLEGKETRILVDSTLTKTGTSNELMDLGASGWFLLRENHESKPGSHEEASFKCFNEFDSSKYLLHWTRRRVGPWPDQSSNEFIDELLFRSPGKDHRSLAALKRILATARIFSSNELTRDNRPVVCFSDISFDELLERRVFRPHLSRWDFEPFGIAIDRDWMSTVGARPVIYGDEQLWDSLADCDRPFFQLNRLDGNIDWSVENEWRVPGDVELRRVPVNKALVFVATESDAREVAPFSRWQVVLLSKE